MQTRERIHQIIDSLPDSELPEIEDFLAQRRTADDPFLRALANAPEDDEPLTPEDIAAIEEGLADLAAGRVISNDELWRRLGHDQAP